MPRVDGKLVSVLSPHQQEEARELYESGVSAAKIGERFGVIKNTIAGLAARKGWLPGNEPRHKAEEPETLMQRIDRLEAGFNRVMAEYPPGTGRITEQPKEKAHAHHRAVAIR